MPPTDAGASGVATVRLARPEDIPEAAVSYSEAFLASVWARMGGRSAQTYLAHWIRDPREFMVVADHPKEGIVGACLATMRIDGYRRALLTANLPRFAAAIVGDVARDPRIGFELGKRVGSGVLETLRNRTRKPEPSPQVERAEPDWPAEISNPGYLAQYYVSPRARGQQLATRMAALAVEIFAEQGFEWCGVHTYSDNIASQTTALRSGFKLFQRTGEQLSYRQYVGEGKPGDLEVRVLDAPDEALVRTWSRLLPKTPEASGFHGWGWIAAHLPEVAAPKFGVVSLKGEPVGVFPLQLDEAGRLCWATQRRSNNCGPVYDPDHLQSVLIGFRQLVDKLQPHVVDLRGLRERSPFFIAARRLVFPELGAPSQANTIGCPEVELDAGWDAVWGRRKKKHRANWRRAHKKLERLGTVAYEELEDADAILETFPAAVRLYEARWEGLNVDIAFGADQMDFQRRAATGLAQDRNVVMSVLRLDGEIIAFAYSLRQGGVSSCYTLAHDDHYAPYSPGQLLLIKILERAAKRGDPLFDFGAGDEAYKAMWSTGRREVFRVVWGPGARRKTALDTLKADLRSRPTLRRIKREGVRVLLPRRGRAKTATWKVEAMDAAVPAGMSATPMTLPEMRALLNDELFTLAIDRAFRGDTAVLVRDGDRPVAVVWRVTAPRARALIEVPDEDAVVFVDPRPLAGDVDLRRASRALGGGLLVTTEPVLGPLASFEADDHNPWSAAPAT